MIKAIYRGIKNDKGVTREAVLSEFNSIYKFEVDGVIKDYCIKNKNDKYTIQNYLIPSLEYLIKVEEDTIIDIEFVNKSDITGVINNYTPGKKTIQNFLKTLLAPLGSTVYVFGGGWNFQDDNASFISKTIGIFPLWEKFYKSTDENYSYKNDTYPNNGFNEYFYAGLDCTGYLGWAIYNTMNTESEKADGFVCYSSVLAKTLADHYNYGVFKNPGNKNYKEIVKMLHPGDIVSIDGHVYVIVGTCSDNSVVIIHSTVTESTSGIKGGGVQMNALSVKGDDDTSCEAYKLVKKYMEKYYSDWTKRYPVSAKPISIYFDFSKENTGVFSWNKDKSGFTDSEEISNMNADDVLKSLFD